MAVPRLSALAASRVAAGSLARARVAPAGTTATAAATAATTTLMRVGTGISAAAAAAIPARSSIRSLSTSTPHYQAQVKNENPMSFKDLEGKVGNKMLQALTVTPFG